MYDKVPTNLNFVEREVQTEQFWKEHDIFGKSIKAREGAPVFTFYDGPPTANGKPHIGHIITRAVKDLIPRYKTMKGYKVLRKAGWDTHGLPVELEVEKSLGLDGKPQIEDYGVEPFIAKCKESVWTYEKEWRAMSDRVGFWADMDHPYVTYHNEYIESEWWALKQIWDKGLLYKGHKVVPYCPRCGTALSSHEVAQGYKDVKETSVIAKFKVEGKDNEYFLAWTTTPWTLPSNVALTVNADETYARVKYQDYVAIMAEALLDTILGEGNYEVLETMKGKELEYMRYEPLFSFLENDPKAFIVTCDPYVTLTDGTGVVHSAGAFGEDDARVCNAYNVPFRQYVDDAGNMTKETGPFAGMFVKDADPKVIEYMEKDGSLFAAIPFEHNYPFCWRCDTPLIYYARSTWFIKMTALRDNLVRNNRTINWYPDNIKEGGEQLSAQLNEMKSYKSSFTVGRLLRDKDMWLIAVGFGLLWMVTVGIVSQFVPRMISVWAPAMGAEAAQGKAMLMLTVAALIGLVGSYFWGWLDQKVGTKPASCVYSLSYIAALLLLIFAQVEILIYIAVLFVGFGIGGLLNLMPSLVISVYGRHDFQAANSLVSPIASLLQKAAFALMAVLLTISNGDYTLPYAVFIGVDVLGLILLLCVTNQCKGRQD